MKLNLIWLKGKTTKNNFPQQFLLPLFWIRDGKKSGSRINIPNRNTGRSNEKFCHLQNNDNSSGGTLLEEGWKLSLGSNLLRPCASFSLSSSRLTVRLLLHINHLGILSHHTIKDIFFLRYFIQQFFIQIHMFLDLLDPDPEFSFTDPDPFINKEKNEEKPWCVLFCEFFYFFLFLKNDVNVN